nr:MAG TPA: hypothetical protein [Bacteriophage sp.]
MSLSLIAFLFSGIYSFLSFNFCIQLNSCL